MLSKDFSFDLRLTDWSTDERKIRAVRTAVFILEQKVPEDLEWDGLDPDCLHILAEERGGRAVGTARMLPRGRIGRMAVVVDCRGQGVGDALLERLLRVARSRGLTELRLDSQEYAIGFYARRGFQVVSDKFLDAGIWHVEMLLELGRVNS